MFKGKWNQMKGKIKEKWGKLTDDELTRVDGKRDQLLGHLQERYGWEQERAEKELRSFEDTFDHEYKENEINPHDLSSHQPKNQGDDTDNFPRRKAG